MRGVWIYDIWLVVVSERRYIGWDKFKIKFSIIREKLFLAAICVSPCLRQTKFFSIRETKFLVGMCVGSSSQRHNNVCLLKIVWNYVVSER